MGQSMRKCWFGAGELGKGEAGDTPGNMEQ